MVAIAGLASKAAGRPVVICYATVVGRADVETRVDRSNVWWLNVYASPEMSIRQMYGANEILGIPAAGLRPYADRRDGP